MAANRVNYASASLSFERNRYGRSPCIWARGASSVFPILQATEDSNDGEFIHDTFMSWGGGAVASKLGNYTGDSAAWHSFEDTGCTIKLSAVDNPSGVATSVNGLGVIKMVSAATAHINAAMEFAGTANASGAGLGAYGLGGGALATAPLSGSRPKIFFEARVRFAQAAAAGAFIGLAMPNKTASANLLMNGSDVFQVTDAIGFALSPVASTGLATSATKLQPFYSHVGAAITAAGQSGFVGNTGGIPGQSTYAGQLITPVVAGVITDFTKLGFVVDPDDVQPLRFYQDGFLLATQTLSQIVAANWPSFVPLNPLFYLQATGSGGAAVELDIDWVDIGIIF